MSLHQKILIIGATPKFCSKEGGCTVLLQNFLNYAHENKHDIVLLHTHRFNNSILNALYFTILFFWNMFRCKYVMYNTNSRGAFIIYYYTAPIAFFFNKKVIFRKYGGFFKEQLISQSLKKRTKMISLLNRSSLVLFETKELVKYMRNLLEKNVAVEWFPNSRIPVEAKRKKDYNKKFIYLSHIYKEKGIEHFVRLSDELSGDYTFDIYGIVMEDKYNDKYFSQHNAKYHGSLKMDEVQKILAQYDFLVLPTYCPTEGYPGIVLEAYSVGLPVIVSKIGGIPEIVEQGVTGEFIKPNNYDSLKEVVLEMNSEKCELLSKGTYKAYNENFNSEVVNKKIFNLIYNL